MRIIEAKNYLDLSRKTANIISANVILNPKCVLGLATGSTPLGAYRQLISWYNRGDIDFSEASSINLDEYCGLAGDNIHSYRYYMDVNFFDNINIPKDRTFLPDGCAAEEKIPDECIRYDALIESLGGIDLQLLGLGRNGHIGFNEPGEAFTDRTHCVELKEDTILANSRFFNSKEEVPKKAITVGLRSIMQAKRLLLSVYGSNKKEIAKKALFGSITPMIPASILQLHADLTVVICETND